MYLGRDLGTILRLWLADVNFWYASLGERSQRVFKVSDALN